MHHYVNLKTIECALCEHSIVMNYFLQNPFAYSVSGLYFFKIAIDNSFFTCSTTSSSKSVRQSTIANPKSIAVPIPRLVIMFPSTTTASSLVIAPVSFSSNPGWQVACLPSSNPAAPKTLGAAQIAATIFPLLQIFYHFIDHFTRSKIQCPRHSSR